MEGRDYSGLPENHYPPLVDIPDKDILDTDILLFQSSEVDARRNGHPGNIYYLKVIQAKEVNYLQSPSWRKMDRVQGIIFKLRQGGIRFLAQQNQEDGSDKDDEQLWYDVGNVRMQVKIAQTFRSREMELDRGLLSKKEIEFTIVEADICDYGDADVVAIKYAQEFYGADMAVADALESVGIDSKELCCAPNSHRLLHTNGGIQAKQVLCLGMPDSLAWDYLDVQGFSGRCLEILQQRAPNTTHFALTLHGVGFGMDEVDCFLSGLRGLLIAMHFWNCPPNLERITIIDHGSERVIRLQQALEQVVSDVDFLEPSHNNGPHGGCRIKPALIPPTHDPLQPFQVGQAQQENANLTIQFTKPSVPPDKWCISYEQLMTLNQRAASFYGPERFPNATMRDIVQDIVIPSCARTGSSYALYLNQEGLPIDAFVSHCWDGHFASFVQSIRDAFQTSMMKPNLWICAFALVQVQRQEESDNQQSDVISQLIGGSDEALDQSPFVQAVKEAAMFCVVRNSQKDIYNRIWCVCELMYAQQCRLFPRFTHVTGPNSFAGRSKTSVLDAEATVIDDRDRILRVLLTEFNRSEIDSIVHQLRIQETPTPMQSS